VSLKISCTRSTERSGESEVEYRIIRMIMKYNPYSTNESNVVKETSYMIDPSLPRLAFVFMFSFSFLFVCLFFTLSSLVRLSCF
jgi:hypothetical protein